MKLLIQYLFLSLTVLAFAGGQASAANSGHMLDNIELIPGEKTSYLTLKGYFEPELLINQRMTRKHRNRPNPNHRIDRGLNLLLNQSG